MTSLFENTQRQVTIHILHDDTLSDTNRQKFIRTAEKYSQGLELHDVTDYKQCVNAKIAAYFRRSFSVGSLYRLLISELLTCNKAIYLDSDTIINMDIQDLWNIDVEGYCIAAYGGDDKRFYLTEWLRLSLMGCKKDTYINAGVMLMNLAEIRKKGNLFQNSLKWANRYLHLMRFGDNDIVNALFYKSIKLIPQRFNNMRRFHNTQSQTETEMANTIIHTAAYHRGWQMTGVPCQKLYWKTYLHSAWGENASREDLIDAIASYMAKAPTKQRPLWKRVLLPVYLWANKSRIYLITKYLVMEAYCRLKYMFIAPR